MLTNVPKDTQLVSSSIGIWTQTLSFKSKFLTDTSLVQVSPNGTHRPQGWPGWRARSILVLGNIMWSWLWWRNEEDHGRTWGGWREGRPWDRGLTRCHGRRASPGPCLRPAAVGTRACQTGSGRQWAAAAPAPSCSSEGSTSPWTLQSGCWGLRGHTKEGSAAWPP